ncbi:MAG: ABC transporter permease [Pirellulales bacterium]|nr:ABC transporter permease [Planctomycetales bacterium]
MIGQLRSLSTLLMLSFSRLLWSVSTLMLLFPLGGCVLFLLRRGYGRELDPLAAFADFSQEFMLFIFAPFIVPICTLAYATMSIGGDREDRTLVFLLMRPIPRAMVFLAKLLATLPLVVGLVVVSFVGFCYLAGTPGETAVRVYLPAVVYMSLAYVALFHVFAILFRHATIIAMVYSLFMEVFIGNMPGLVKRITVSFYGRSMIFGLGLEHGLDPPPAEWFAPVTPTVGAATLLGITAASVLAGVLIFQYREYRDLT